MDDRHIMITTSWSDTVHHIFVGDTVSAHCVLFDRNRYCTVPIVLIISWMTFVTLSPSYCVGVVSIWISGAIYEPLEYMNLCMNFCMNLGMNLCMNLCICISIWISVYTSLFMNPCIWISIWISIRMSIWISGSISFAYMNLCIWISVYESLHMNRYVNLYMNLWQHLFFIYGIRDSSTRGVRVTSNECLTCGVRDSQTCRVR